MSRYDYIIVGAGTAGAVLSGRLSADPGRRVLLLEAGPDFADEAALPPILATGEPTTEDGFEWELDGLIGGVPQHYARGRVMGGSSQVNSRGAVRAPASDFAEWAALGLPRWNFDAVLPAYCRLENDAQFGHESYHGQDGPMPITRWERDEFVPAVAGFVDGLRALGHAYVPDLNAPSAVGVGPYPQNRRGQLRVSTSLAYLAAARDRANLVIAAGTEVTRIVVRGDRAIGVEAGGELIEAGEVIVCAGAPYSPVLLLRSGIGPMSDLGALGVPTVADLAGVGAHLIDQPGVVLFAVPTPDAAPPNWPRLQALARLAGFPGYAQDDGFYLCLFGMDLGRGPAAGLADMIGARHVNGLMVGDMRPASRGRVTLTAADPAAAPLLDLGFYTAGDDLDRMVAGLRYAWQLATDDAFAATVDHLAFLDDSVVADDEQMAAVVRMSTFSRTNMLGGCRMGPASDGEAVVDQEFRVHGLGGLRVVDASVVPVALRAPAALTAMMLGEYAAEMIMAESG